MKLIQIQKHNLPQYASILPDSLLRYPGEIFVCVKNEIPYGAIALEKLGNHLGINWLWVAPEKRRQRLGSALLIKAYQFAKQQFTKQRNYAKNPTTYISVNSGTKILYQHTNLNLNVIPLIMP